MLLKTKPLLDFAAVRAKVFFALSLGRFGGSRTRDVQKATGNRSVQCVGGGGKSPKF